MQQSVAADEELKDVIRVLEAKKVEIRQPLPKIDSLIKQLQAKPSWYLARKSAISLFSMSNRLDIRNGQRLRNVLRKLGIV
jgi:hypothetical protein